ncbi:MAG: hypothetical protein ACI8RZ_003856 [Myxococcota bacterium]
MTGADLHIGRREVSGLRAEVAGGWGYAHGTAIYESPGGDYLCLGLANHSDLGAEGESAVVLINLDRLADAGTDLTALLMEPDYVILSGADGFGSILFSEDGQLLVGAPFDGTKTPNAGAIYRFEGDPADWPTTTASLGDWQVRLPDWTPALLAWPHRPPT